jgi:hypothetical protein
MEKKRRQKREKRLEKLVRVHKELKKDGNDKSREKNN